MARNPSSVPVVSTHKWLVFAINKTEGIIFFFEIRTDPTPEEAIKKAVQDDPVYRQYANNQEWVVGAVDTANKSGRGSLGKQLHDILIKSNIPSEEHAEIIANWERLVIETFKAMRERKSKHGTA